MGGRRTELGHRFTLLKQFSTNNQKAFCPIVAHMEQGKMLLATPVGRVTQAALRSHRHPPSSKMLGARTDSIT
jgi:pyruvate-formate lyase